MNTPKNTHQILYAKNFYRQTGNIIADMRKVCKLDEPNWDFSSPQQILKFMRKQYAIWLENTPEVDKEVGSKVAWDDNPISAEMWSIMSAYACYIPLSSKYIHGLPNYHVLKPQYNAYIGYTEREHVFTKDMTVEQLTQKAKELLDRTNLEIADIIADDACRRFDYKKAAMLLEEFGEKVTPEELDNELWDGYSNLIGLNIDENGNLPERYYHCFTKHFSIGISPVFQPNHTFSIDIDLIPFRFESVSENDITDENLMDEMKKLTDNILNEFRTSGALSKISEVANRLFENDDNYIIWDVPKHLTGTEEDLFEDIKDCIDYDNSYDSSERYKRWFKKCIDKYDPGWSRSGSFAKFIYNENGKLKVVVPFETLFECGALDHELWNGCIVAEAKY